VNGQKCTALPAYAGQKRAAQSLNLQWILRCERLRGICNQCHSEVTSSFDQKMASQDYDGNGKIEPFITEINGLMAKLKAKLPQDSFGNVISSAADTMKIYNRPDLVQESGIIILLQKIAATVSIILHIPWHCFKLPSVQLPPALNRQMKLFRARLNLTRIIQSVQPYNDNSFALRTVQRYGLMCMTCLENWLRRYTTDRGKREIGMLNGMGPTRMASIFPACLLLPLASGSLTL